VRVSGREWQTAGTVNDETASRCDATRVTLFIHRFIPDSDDCRHSSLVLGRWPFPSSLVLGHYLSIPMPSVPPNCFKKPRRYIRVASIPPSALPLRGWRAVLRRARGPARISGRGWTRVDRLRGHWGPAILGARAAGGARRRWADAATRGVSFGIPNPYEVEMAGGRFVRGCHRSKRLRIW
jgi:hypothetical protein